MPSWLPDSLHLSVQEAHCATPEGETLQLYICSEVTGSDDWELNAVTEKGQWYKAKDVPNIKETVEGKDLTVSEQFADVWAHSPLVVTQEEDSVLSIRYSQHHQRDITLHLVSEQSLHPVSPFAHFRLCVLIGASRVTRHAATWHLPSYFSNICITDARLYNT